MIAKIGRMLLASLVPLAVASTALAQGNTFNPYGNSGYADYREFGNPMYSNNPALPGQSVLNSQQVVNRPRANSFQDYANDLESTETGSSAARRGSTANLPYYQAYQRTNPEYNRIYRPNNTEADRKFQERQREREQKYATATNPKTDPVTRTKLLKELERDTLDHPSALSRPTSAKTANGSKPNPPAPPATGARGSAPAERRQTAPPPFSGDSSRSSSRGASRAPAPNGAGPATAPKPSTASRNRPAPDPSTIQIPPPR